MTLSEGTINVDLLVKTKTGENAFGEPVFSSEWISVSGCLVAPMSEQEILETWNLTGRKAIYQIAVPKGDTHSWTNTLVKFFGETWRTISEPIQGIDALIPLGWNKKVKVESIVKESQD